MKQCYACFKIYEKEYEICPYCGAVEMNTVTEQRYLEPGILLQGRYLLGIVIGAGGFGITYAAWDQVLAQRVAIKEYLPGEFSTRAGEQTQVTIYGGEKSEQFMSGKEKFHEESKRLAKLRNVPGIVQIYDSFEENGTVYIVMEYLEGETLDARLKREGKIPEKEAVEIMLPVLQALDRVHKEGILHRDIAPNNIFLTKEGEVKLLDFGAARSATGSHSKSLTVLYKEGYTPEEQYRSRGDQGPWTDVYACAATLYKMLTGKIPPGAMERRRKDTLKAPSKNGAKVSREVDVAILNALNVEVKYRTQSAEQFIKELTGEVKGKKHFIRTIEKKVGKLPLGVKIGAGLAGILAGIFLILLFAGVIRFEVSGFGNILLAEGKSRVPNVVNREIEEAQKKLEDSRLKCLIVDKQFSEEIPKDRILSQSVSAGKVTDEGTIIEVVVSGGVPNQKNGYELKDGETFVPDIEYKSLEEAMRIIEEAGMVGEVRYEIDETVEEGKVIKQESMAGELATRGKTLVFYVNGVEPTEEIEEAVVEESVEEQIVEATPEVIQELPWGNEGGIKDIKEALLTQVNQRRASVGVPALVWNNEMEAEAKSHQEALSQGMLSYSAYVSFYVFNNSNSSDVSQIVAEMITSSSPHDKLLLSANYQYIGGSLNFEPTCSEHKYHWIICLGPGTIVEAYEILY